MGTLSDIKNASLLLNRLSEVHAESLPRFAFIALENVDTVEVEYDLDNQIALSAPSSHSGFFVVYKITTKNKKKGVGDKARSAKNRMQDVVKWVKSSLFNEVQVKFVVNGKEIAYE